MGQISDVNCSKGRSDKKYMINTIQSNIKLLKISLYLPEIHLKCLTTLSPVCPSFCINFLSISFISLCGISVISKKVLQNISTKIKKW